jgi:exodeoxyribonuclease-3
MRLVTWNVNSLRVRQERIETWLAEVQPDIVCMQETKLADDGFPALSFSALGYESAHFGQGQWNGVAILSRVGLENVVVNFSPGIEPDPDARIITATCGGVRVSSCYVPNGRALDDDHYIYKLSWLDRLLVHLERDTSPGADVVVAGDFNIAPTDVDVYDPRKFVGATHVSEPERSRLATLKDWGLTDLFRQQHPDAASVYSWWDYRAGDFHQGRGLRIDLVLGSASVAARVEWAMIDRNARKGDKPSDHAPVVIDLRN